MAEFTERGEQDRRRDEEKMTGEPTTTPRPAAGAAGDTTRDKGKAPADDPGGEKA